MLNDMEACCYGLLDLHARKQFSSYFDTLFRAPNADSDIPDGGNLVVMNPGTGLGVALLIWNKLKKEFEVLPGEAGHTLIAPGHTGTQLERDFEARLMRFIAQSAGYKDLGANVEYEDIASGRGLQWTYEYLCRMVGAPAAECTADAETIGNKARAGDVVARLAMLWDYRMIMRIGQTLSIAVFGKGVVLCGGNEVTNDSVVRSFADELSHTFFDHPKAPDDRFAMRQNMSVWKQIRPENLNTLGCHYFAKKCCLP
jgi:glucokinase